MFVFDVTETAGAKSSFQHQLAVYEKLRATFPQRPWINVVTKNDLNPHPDLQRDSASVNTSMLPSDCMFVSVKNPSSLLALQDRVVEHLELVEEKMNTIKEG